MMQRLKRILKRKTTRRSQQNSFTAEVLEVRTLLAAVTEIDVDFAEPFNPVEFDGRIYFAGNASGGGYELLAADQTGVEVIHDLGQLDPGYLENLVHVVDDSLIFVAHTSELGTELYRTDGTAAGTELLADINPAVGESGVTADFWATAATMTQTDRLVFFADDATHGSEPWVSDGTTAGTQLLKDVRGGLDSSNPNSLLVSHSTAYFLADDGLHGEELWRSDGTVDGTEIVGNFSTGAASSQITHMTTDGGSGILFQVGWDTSVWHVPGKEQVNSFDYSRQRISVGRELADIDIDYSSLGSTPWFRMIYADSGSVYQHRNDHAQDFYGAIVQSDSGIPGRFYDADLVLVASTTTDSAGNETIGGRFLGTDFGRMISTSIGPVLRNSDGEFSVEGPITLNDPERGSFYIVATEQVDGTFTITEYDPGYQPYTNKHTGLSDVSMQNAGVFNNLVWLIAEGDVYSTGYSTIQETDFGGVEDIAVTDHGVYAAVPSQNKLLFIDGQLDAPTWLTPQTAIDGNAEWAAVDGVDHYEFTESDQPAPPANTFWNSHLTSTTETSVQPAEFGQRYLHVRAVSGSVRSEWSTIVVFNAAIPNLVSPGPDNLIGQDDSYYEHLRGFELQVDYPLAEIEIYRFGESEPVVTKNTWDGIAEANGTVRSPELPIGEYEWRARSVGERLGQTVKSAWSEVQSFRIATDGVTLLTPVDEYTGWSQRDPILNWTRYQGFDHSNTESATDSYKLQVYNLSTGTTEVLVDVNDTKYTIEEKLPVGRYRAWVLPFDQGQRMEWSRPIDFDVGIRAIVFTNSNNNDALTVRVGNTHDSVTYELWINHQGGESGIIHETDIEPDYVLPDTLPDGRYRAFVRATYESGEQSEWTDAINFTKGQYDYPLITSVPNQTEWNSSYVYWRGPEAATTWRLFLRNQTTGTDTIVPETELTRTNYSIYDQSLEAGDYSVWVRGYHDGGAVTKWSAGESFTITAVVGPVPYFSFGLPPNTFHRSDRFELGFWDSSETIAGYEVSVLHIESGYVVTESKMTQEAIDFWYVFNEQIPAGNYQFSVRYVFDDGSFSDKLFHDVLMI